MYKTPKLNFINQTTQNGANVVGGVNNLADRLNKKFKGTIVENWIRFWKNVFTDYRELAKDIRKDVKEKPVKSFFVFSGLGFFSYCLTHNPNETLFRAQYVESANKLLLVHPGCQNPRATQHLRYIEKCYNQNLIRRLNIGIASFMWIDNFSGQCKTYEHNCSYLKLKYLMLKDRIVDFGFLNHWWVLSRKMLDYDINY